jgi:uncharacterized protein (TIGR00369 family)
MAEMQRTLQALLETTNVAAFGFRVVQADEGWTRLHVPARASHLRPGEIVAGYVLVAAADVAVWLAIKTLLGVDDRSVTIDLHTSFLAAAASDFNCDARIVHCGRRIVTGVATSSDAARDLAVHTVAYARRERTDDPC